MVCSESPLRDRHGPRGSARGGCGCSEARAPRGGRRHGAPESEPPVPRVLPPAQPDTQVLPPLCAPVLEPNLDPGLREINAQCEFLAHEYIGVMRPGKKFLQSSELLWGEGRSVPPLQTVNSDSLKNISTGEIHVLPIERGANPPGGSANIRFCQNFQKNCIIESMLGSRGRPG